MSGTGLFAAIVTILAVFAMTVSYLSPDPVLFALGAFFAVVAGALPQITSSRP